MLSRIPTIADESRHPSASQVDGAFIWSVGKTYRVKTGIRAELVVDDARRLCITQPRAGRCEPDQRDQEFRGIRRQYQVGSKLIPDRLCLLTLVGHLECKAKPAACPKWQAVHGLTYLVSHDLCVLASKPSDRRPENEVEVGPVTTELVGLFHHPKRIVESSLQSRLGGADQETVDGQGHTCACRERSQRCQLLKELRAVSEVSVRVHEPDAAPTLIVENATRQSDGHRGSAGVHDVSDQSRIARPSDSGLKG